MNLMFQPFRKYAVFKGRARRAEYWWFYLLFAIAYVALTIATDGFNEDPAFEPSGLQSIIALAAGAAILAMLIPLMAVTVRRLHDIDRSGWWIVLSFVPLVGGLIVFVFTVLNGTPGPNRFGADPKAEVGATDVSVFS
jgi:uncharacterized membrane protein YhaH (DUF805 family)